MCYYFDKGPRDGTWELIDAPPHRAVREEAGRFPEPCAGIMDSQSIQIAEVGDIHGNDAGKHIMGPGSRW
ncbi:MAG: transposase [Chloroflexi bacterium]|nr:transposase [Chloroflexota bacterium]